MALTQQREHTGSCGCAEQQGAPCPGPGVELRAHSWWRSSAEIRHSTPRGVARTVGSLCEPKGASRDEGQRRTGQALESHADPGPQGLPAASPWTGSKLLNLAYLSHL